MTDLEVTWHGALWREAEPPPIVSALPDYSGVRDPVRRTKGRLGLLPTRVRQLCAVRPYGVDELMFVTGAERHVLTALLSRQTRIGAMVKIPGRPMRYQTRGKARRDR